jgi:hypothetical protein
VKPMCGPKPTHPAQLTAEEGKSSQQLIQATIP